MASGFIVNFLYVVISLIRPESVNKIESMTGCENFPFWLNTFSTVASFWSSELLIDINDIIDINVCD